MEQLPSSQHKRKLKVRGYGWENNSTGYLLFSNPDQLLAEVLEDEGEEPVAVEGVAYTNDVIVYYCVFYISCRGTW